MGYITDNLEERIIQLLGTNLMSVSQVASILGLRKDIAAGHLEALKRQGKLELFVVGKSNVYTVPRRVESAPHQHPSHGARTIGIVSSKGGVGKTTLTINLAAAMMELGRNVIAIDTDVKTSNLGLQLGMYYFPLTLNDVLRDGHSMLEAMYIHKSGLRIIPASLGVETLETYKLRDALQGSMPNDSIVLLDSPAGLESNAMNVLRACSEVLVVTTPELPSIANVIKTIDAVRETGCKPIGVVVNKYRRSDPHQVNVKEIEFACELPVMGAIPEMGLRKSMAKGMPAVIASPYHDFSVAVKKTAAKLVGADYEEPKFRAIRQLIGDGKK